MSSQRRILILAEGKFSPLRSKTANAAIVYLHDEVVAVIDSTKAGKTAQDVLGYGGAVPVVQSLEDGFAFAPTHLLIGIAPPGGRLPQEWFDMLKKALMNRLHILNGLHTLLTDVPELVALAKQHDVIITDWRRIPPESEVVAKGLWRARKAKTILAVGSDCNIGKMTTTLAVHKEFLGRGLKSEFVATGQTGMMISNNGIAIDSIIGDYIAGCIELEVAKAIDKGFDFIFVEGQGALTHIGYSGVTLGLIHGVMPDAMILCHQPTRLTDDYGLPLPDLRRIIRLHEEIVSIFKPTKVVGIGINSIGLTDDESRREADRLEQVTGLPAIDAFRFGGVKLADALFRYFDMSRLFESSH